MARRGGAEPATSLREEIRDLAPDPSPPPASNTFSDPLRADAAPSSADEPSPAPSPRPDVPPPPSEQPEGAGEDAFDARSEITRLQDELRARDQRDQLFQRELALRLAGAQQVGGQPSGDPQVDPTLQEGLDILQVTEDDLVQVFQGGPQGAAIVSRALQAVYLLAVNATERRLINYYNQDQGSRAQQQAVQQRAQQMHDTFWEAYPELQQHEVIVQHYAREVALEQQQSPRFDWDSAQREVARRTMHHLRGTYNVSFPAPGTQPPAAGYGVPQPQRPMLQQRIRPVVGEMGGGAGRGATNGSQRSQLTSEILDLGRR